jgi:hypothetical protein
MTPVCTTGNKIGSAVRGTAFSTRAQIALAACTCGAASAFVFAVDPNHHAIYPQCFLYNATGIYCAGCGATRALYALLHGRVLDALHDNALFVASLPLLAYVIGSYVLRAWRVNSWPTVSIDGRKALRVGGSIFAVMIVFMILRNLPGSLFDYLKPLAAGG